MRAKLGLMSCLPGPHGHEVAVLRSSRLMNQAQEPRFTGWQALHATAELASNRFPAGYRFSLTRMGFIPAPPVPRRRWVGPNRPRSG